MSSWLIILSELLSNINKLHFFEHIKGYFRPLGRTGSVFEHNVSDSQGPPLKEPEATLSVHDPHIVDTILDIVQGYGMHTSDNRNILVHGWAGKRTFARHVQYWVNRNAPINFVLPAFPFKSCNLDKVTGHLPDMGDYLGLARLNAMCVDIQNVYAYGAQVTLASDGAVFNDIFNIPDEHVWEYSKELISIAKEEGFDANIKIVHVMELLGHSVSVAMKPISRETFLSTIFECREHIRTQLARPDILSKRLEEDPDSLRTYTQMKHFLEIDLAHSTLAGLGKARRTKLSKSLARDSMARSEAFTKLIVESLPNHVRLSVHASSGAAKLSFPLVPQGQGAVFRVPWMSSIAVTLDGRYRCLHSLEARADHEVVKRNGRTWCYRERHEVFQSLSERSIEVVHLYPRGVQLSAAGPDGAIFTEKDLESLKALGEKQPVYVKGFTNVIDGQLF